MSNHFVMCCYPKWKKEELNQYRKFLDSKRQAAEPSGLEVDVADVNTGLFRWQQDIVRWALRQGRCALFEDCGLGKTVQQLEWGKHVAERTEGLVLILCPLAVQSQTVAEHARFGIGCKIAICESDADITFDSGIVVSNYEKLHKFKPERFIGVVLDESSILKSFTGVTKRTLIKAFAATRYRLCCTATPAPNDRMEIGNHAEFLGIMPSNEMLARWFINDTMQCGNYRLRKHGAKDFWRWMASWSVAIAKPSDLGHSDDGFVLPELRIHEHIVKAPVPRGHLFFPGGDVSATNVHRVKRSCLDDRADVVAGLVNEDGDGWVVWCDTDYEADALIARIPDAVEVRGSQPEKVKTQRLTEFSEGKFRVIITKPEIGGFGLNWQHVRKTSWFAGYSFERFYQSIRRLYRFGQKHPVEVHIVMSEAEQSILASIERKSRDHRELQAEMSGMMRDAMLEQLYGRLKLETYNPQIDMEVPGWLVPQNC